MMKNIIKFAFSLMLSTTAFAQTNYKETITELGAKIKDAQPALNTKWIAIQLKDKNDIHIYNISKKKIIGKIPVFTTSFEFVVGGDKLIVYYKDVEMLQLWNLKTAKKVKSILNPMPNQITDMSMGSNSPTRVLLGSSKKRFGKDFAILDLKTMKLANLRSLVTTYEGKPKTEELDNKMFKSNSRSRSRVVSNLKGDCFYIPSSFGMKAYKVTRDNSVIKLLEIKSNMTPAAVGYGDLLTDGRSTIIRPNLSIQNTAHKGIVYIPSKTGATGLSMERNGALWLVKNNGGNKLFQIGKVPSFYDPRRQETIDDFHSFGSLTVDKYPVLSHFHLNQKQGALCILPFSGSSIIQRQFNLKSSISTKGKSAAILKTSPNITAKSGKPLRIPLRFLKLGKRFECSVEIGPNGCSVKNNVLLWIPPASAIGSTQKVIINATDKAGNSSMINLFITVS